MMNLVASLFSICLIVSAQVTAQEKGSAPPRIWIFNGLPGDEIHHAFYEKNLSDIRKSLNSRFKIPDQNISVFYGPREAGYDGAATRENVLAALEEVVKQGGGEKAGPVWLIFQGHANRIPGGANFNLPGPDLSARDIARALKDFPKEQPLVIIATTAAASDFLTALSAPGRIVIAASVARDPVSETEFPLAFSAALAAPDTDRNKDGAVSAEELFLFAKQRVIEIYESEGYMIREHAQLDGNGDGKGTQRPAEEDAGPAAKVALRIPKGSQFE